MYNRVMINLSLVIGLMLFVAPEFIANDKPLFIRYRNNFYFPILFNYDAQQLGLAKGLIPQYHHPVIQAHLNQHGTYWMPPIPYSPNSHDLHVGKTHPQAPGKVHILGTDDQGRDVLARVIYTLRFTMISSLILTFVSMYLGTIIGTIAAFHSGWVDIISQQIIHLCGSIPATYLCIILASVAPIQTWIILLIISAVQWTYFAQLARAEVLQSKHHDHIITAQYIGLTSSQIIYRHLFPKTLRNALIQTPWKCVQNISSIASLEMLGLGINPNHSHLGELIIQAYQHPEAPWLTLSVCLAIWTGLSLTFHGIHTCINQYLPNTATK